MNHLIGITGKAGSGKDTVAHILHTRRGYHCMALAAPLRAGLMAMLGLDGSHFEHPKKEQLLPIIDKSPRQLLQLLGTEWGRHLIHPELWTMLATRRIADIRALNPGVNIIISDVRFDNEAHMIRQLGGEVWHISRAGAGTPHAHISESGIVFDEADRIIQNNGTIIDLHNTVQSFVLDYLMPFEHRQATA